MAKKKKPSVFSWVVGGFIVLWIIGKIDTIWPILVIAGFIYIVYKAYKNTQSSSTPQRDQRIERSTESLNPRVHQSGNNTDEPFLVHVSGNGARAYAVPPSPSQISDGKWIPKGQVVEIGRFSILSGMIYVGTTLPTYYGQPDPALINPRKSIAKSGNFTEDLPGYWPSYSDITGQARHAYLQWLSEGRTHPEAEIGYVFLFFCGLERRALIDLKGDRNSSGEIQEIISECKRLLAIYGEKSHSFAGYCGRFLEYLELTNVPERSYDSPVPDLGPSSELSYYLRIAIGQAMLNKSPIPGHVALAWAEQDPAVMRRTAVSRCKAEFRRLFEIKYKQQFDVGMKLTPNLTKLKLIYRPASAGFRGGPEIVLDFGDIPDVTALTKPIKLLQIVVDACTEELDAYSRFVGRNPGQELALEGLLLLPVDMWPQPAKDSLDQLIVRASQGMALMSMRELADTFSAIGELSKERIRGLALALYSKKVGIEPDILEGSKTPKAENKIALFKIDSIVDDKRAVPAYQIAAVTLELAAAVAHADGEFSASELDLLNIQIESWVHLTPTLQRRLKCRARLLMIEPVSLAILKKKVESLDPSAREMIAGFAASLVQSDTKAAAVEIKLLEKIYKLLGVEQNKVYSAVHQSATSPGLIAKAKPAGGFVLDKDKIAALQQDSESLSSLLGSIFKEEADTPAPIAIVEENLTNNAILGLDDAHSAFARMLLSRISWSRQELGNIAQDLEVMLDGALEKLNEAAFDTYDFPFTDGDDPIEISPEIIEKLAI